MERRDFLKFTLGSAALVAPAPLSRKQGDVPPAPPAEAAPAVAPPSPAELLFPLKEGEVKFKVQDLAAQFRHKDHEGWMLDAYPDPAVKTVALIGAGFNLSITEEIKRIPGDPNDPYQHNGKIRKEPTTAELWKAAGIPEQKLADVLDAYEKRRKIVGGSRRVHRALEAGKKLLGSTDITEQEADALLLISTRHAVHNAMAYAKDWHNMTSAQQIGMSQLVYQMGSNLDKFTRTLAAINDTSYREPPKNAARLNEKQLAAAMKRQESNHWRDVQDKLMDSSWFKNYTFRATKVVARFDPDFTEASPEIYEQRVKARFEAKNKAAAPAAPASGASAYDTHEAAPASMADASPALPADGFTQRLREERGQPPRGRG